MPKVFTRKNEISDVLKYEVDKLFCREGMEVDNTTGTTELEFKTGECYVKSTHTILTDTVPAIPAAWTVNFSDNWNVAVPEIYTIKIGGTWAENDTLTIGSTTFTAKANPTTSNEFSANGTGEIIVQDIKNCSLAVTSFTITYEGDTIILTQTVPGTGDAPTCTKSSTAGTAVLSDIQNYHAADTITIGSVTYTCSTATLTSTTFAPGTGTEVVLRLKTLGASQTGYDVTFAGANITFTQSTASSTETAPTCTASATVATITTTKTQDYSAAVEGNTSSIDFWCLENKKIPAGYKDTVLGVVRGPAIVDISNIITNYKEGMKAQLLTKNIITTEPSPASVYQET